MCTDCSCSTHAVTLPASICRQLKADGASEGTLEVVTRAITMLTINNKANQDYIRYGMPLITSFPGPRSTALRASAMDPHAITRCPPTCFCFDSTRHARACCHIKICYSCCAGRWTA